MQPQDTRFCQLDDLCNESRSSIVKFSAFTLTAIILHDPTNIDFKVNIQDAFENIALASDNNFLAITFVEPTKYIKYKHLNSNQKWRINLSIEDGIDNTDSLFKLKQHFQLKYHNYPLILLTNDIRSDKCFVVETSDSVIEKQLKEIKCFCATQQRPSNINNVLFCDLVRNIGGNPKHFIQTDAAICEILADVEAENNCDYEFTNDDVFYNDEDYNNHYNRLNFNNNFQLGFIQLNQEISFGNRIRNVIQNSKAYIERKKYERKKKKFDNATKCINDFARYVVEHPGVAKDDLSEIDAKLESAKESLSFIKKVETGVVPANDICKMIKHIDLCENSSISEYLYFLTLENMNNNELIKLNLNIDVDHNCADLRRTLQTYCLSKLFETEMSKSVVQMMRKALGVEMPWFYCKYVPNSKFDINVQTPNGFDVIDFNNSYNDEWKAPELGKSILAYKEMNRLNSQYKDFEYFDDKFVKNWRFMANSRNNAAHAGLVNEVEYVKALRAFSTISRIYFTKILEIKRNMRGN